MGKIKIEKKDIWIDMTPMSDVMTLLLCFFMLTSTFLTPEPVKVNTPGSVSEVKVPENDVLNILVSPEGNIYVGSENKNTMLEMMQTVTDKFGVSLTGEKLKHFREDAMIGAPMAMFEAYYALDAEKMGEKIQKLSIPLDSIDGGKSEFQEWVTAARESNPDIRLAIKADAKTSYAVIKASKQKKMDTRVNFTPMVDMMMLLITFFMLCTTLSKPQAMQLTMPSNDENMSKEDKSVTKASYTITLYLGANDKLYYVEGLPEYDNAECLKETTWGKDGVRNLLIKHVTEDGFSPVAKVMMAKKKLDEKKAQMGDKMSKEEYDKLLSDIRNGKNVDGEEIQTLTVIIKPMDVSTYDNMVQALDEMLVCSIGKYVIDKVNEDDQKLLELKGIKYAK